MNSKKTNQDYKHEEFLFKKLEKIPKDWEIQKLIDFCKAKPQYGSNVAAIKKSSNLPRYLRITDVDEDGKLKNNKWVSISEDDSKDYLLHDNDFLFARTGATVGKTFVYKKEYGRCAYATSLIKFVIDEKKLNVNYLLHYAHSSYYYRWLCTFVNMANREVINARTFSQMPIIIPKRIQEQEKIENILLYIDRLIQQTYDIIKQTTLLKNGIVSKLQTRGIRKDVEFKKINLNRHVEITIPKKWTIKTLSDISLSGTQSGYAISDNDYGSGIPIVGMTSLFKNNVLDSTNLKEVSLSKEVVKKFYLKEGDLLFGRRSLTIEGAGKCILVTKLSKPTIFESSVIRLSLNRDVIPNYIHIFLTSDLGKKLIHRIKQIVAVSGIKSSDLKKIKIPLPEIDEQKEILYKLSYFQTKIQLLGEYNSKLKTIKNGLIEQLFTGQVRVKV